jgi:hypothetical protein
VIGRGSPKRIAAVMVGNSAASRLAHLHPELALLRGAG